MKCTGSNTEVAWVTLGLIFTADCPYCDYYVRTTNPESHKTFPEHEELK